MSKPSLYGVVNSNRSEQNLWGKNQFNSAFPVSLCCYMRDHGMRPVYIAVNSDFSHRIEENEITFADVFGASAPGANIRFEFETAFGPFREFLYDSLDRIDLVTKDASGTKFLNPLEVKLTVVPDSATCKLENESSWSSELVIRPTTSSYAALSIYNSIGQCATARNIVEPLSSEVQDWNNATEISSKKTDIIDRLQEYLKTFHEKQKPFLIHPIWKTKGKSPQLADNCFDVFVWSDFAVCKAFINLASESKSGKLSRSMRECARMLRCLNELHTKGKVNIQKIYKGMGMGSQTDKALALSGTATHQYMRHERLTKPALTKDVLKDIILNGGERLLSPERRFDATIYYTCRELLSGQTHGN